VSPRTEADTAALIRTRIEPAPFYKQKLGDLTHRAVQMWVKGLTDSGLAPRTVRMAYGVLSQALSQAVALDYLPRNVAKVGMKLPQMKNRPLRALTQEQAQAFLAAARGDRWYPLFLVLLTGGLRPGEAFGLQWQDLEGSAVRVRRSVVRLTGVPYALRPPKTDRERTVSLPAMTVSAIEEFRATLPEAYQAPDAFMFPNGDGHPLEHNNFVHRHFKPILTRAKLPDHRLYDLRHTCATLLLKDGEQIKVVSERLGHKDINLTLAIYTHVLPGMSEAAAARFDTLLKPKLKLA
jgi:integrase